MLAIGIPLAYTYLLGLVPRNSGASAESGRKI